MTTTSRINILRQGDIVYTAPVTSSSKRVRSLSGEDYIQLVFNAAEVITFMLGDYVLWNGEKYEIVTPQQGKAKEGALSYEIIFEASYRKMQNKIMKFCQIEGGRYVRSEAKWSLTADLGTHLGEVLKNLRDLGITHYDGREYQFAVDSSVSTEAKLISYEDTDILSALYLYAEQWECDFWVEDNVLRFGRCEWDGAGDTIKQGISATEISVQESEEGYATRYFAYGSDKNITNDYRKTENTIGIVQRRLTLPADTPYIDVEEDLSPEQIVERVVVFDDVYPSRTGEISKVETYKVTDTTENADGTTTETQSTIYRFRDDGIIFSADYVIEGQTLQAVFRTGKLAGMTFDIAFNPYNNTEMAQPEKIDGQPNPEAQKYEIIRNDNYGTTLPNDVLYPQVGDKYDLIGFDLSLVSDVYIPEAEQRLKKELQDYIEENRNGEKTYTAKLISKWAYNNGNPRAYEIGEKVKVSTPFAEVDSRIIGYELCLDIPWDSPTYTIGKAAAATRLGQLQDTVETLTYSAVSQGYQGVEIVGTNSRKAATDSNVFSAKRSESQYLSKDKDDVTKGTITAKGFKTKGLADLEQARINLAEMSKAEVTDLQAYIAKVVDTLTARRALVIEAIMSEEYAGGMVGYGFKIDASGKAQMRSLELFESLIVPELRYNRVSVIAGEQWQSAGGGVIEAVDETTQTFVLRLEEGELPTLDYNDLCKGIYHFGGDSPVKGFQASYFKILGVSEGVATKVEGNTLYTDGEVNGTTITLRGSVDNGILAAAGEPIYKVRYELRPGTTIHPQPKMNFVAYGNTTNVDRQQSIYSTLRYKRYLIGVNDWDIREENIAMQLGDLSELVIGGQKFEGYSAYLSNVYLTGGKIITGTDNLKILDSKGKEMAVFENVEQADGSTMPMFKTDLIRVKKLDAATGTFSGFIRHTPMVVDFSTEQGRALASEVFTLFQSEDYDYLFPNFDKVGQYLILKNFNKKNIKAWLKASSAPDICYFFLPYKAADGRYSEFMLAGEYENPEEIKGVLGYSTPAEMSSEASSLVGESLRIVLSYDSGVYRDVVLQFVPLYYSMNYSEAYNYAFKYKPNSLMDSGSAAEIDGSHYDYVITTPYPTNGKADVPSEMQDYAMPYVAFECKTEVVMVGEVPCNHIYWETEVGYNITDRVVLEE